MNEKEGHKTLPYGMRGDVHRRAVNEFKKNGEMLPTASQSRRDFSRVSTVTLVPCVPRESPHYSANTTNPTFPPATGTDNKRSFRFHERGLFDLDRRISLRKRDRRLLNVPLIGLLGQLPYWGDNEFL